MEFSAGQARVEVNVPDWVTLEDAVRNRFAQREGFALATLNLDHLAKLRRDRDFARAYAAQDLVVADGNPIVWLSKLAGHPVELIPGSDAILPLCRIAEECRVHVGLVGSTEEVLAKARIHLTREVPGLNIVALISPPYGFDPEGDEAREVFSRLRVAGARLCFVALGAPKQEQFAAAGRAFVPEIGFAGIGAGLDFFAGHQKRAPRWMRAMALEWLWRMLSNPKRLVPRYLQSAAILPGLTLRAMRQR